MIKIGRYRLFALVIPALLLGFSVAGTGKAADQAPLSPFSMDTYGSLPGARVGDVVTVVSAGKVLCGRFTIRQDDEYGFLHVYGDDPGTALVEGAGPNEGLNYYLNGTLLIPRSSQNVLWLGDGRKQQVDFMGR